MFDVTQAVYRQRYSVTDVTLNIAGDTTLRSLMSGVVRHGPRQGALSHLMLKFMHLQKLQDSTLCHI